jgi:hypothetical protein
MIHNLVITLESVKLAVEAFCCRDATLLSADIMIFLCDHQFGRVIRLAVRLKESLSRLMNQKRTKVPSLRQYLHSNTTKTMLNWSKIAMSRLNLNRTMRQLK